MKLIGQGYEPLDMSRPDHEEVFTDAMNKWLELSKLKGPQGPPSIEGEGIELKPYGTAY